MWSRTLTKPLGKVLGKRLLEQVIEQERPDTVVATHAYCLPALAEAKRQASKPFHLINVITDFHINHFWINSEVDYYVVPHERIGEQLAGRHNVAPAKIHAYGIPVRAPFAKQADRQKQEWRAELGLVPDLFTVLIGGGEGGYGKIAAVVKRLMELEKPLQIIAVTGKNAALLERLRARFSGHPASRLLHLLGYTDAMWQWIGAADAYITKPGGLTCSEALAMKTPLVLYQPLPGQERINCRFLREQQAAEEAVSVEEIIQVIMRWQTAREQWSELASRMGRLGRPDSAYRTAEMILAL
jgi:processive 1,2-diacylglycerol beta-glucosyltransferase